MKIAIATPLYPPDLGSLALYVKELAMRLKKEHEVTIIAYTHLPEPIPGVHIIAISKRQPLPLRLIAYFFALLRLMREADVVQAENGASVELPLTWAARLCRTPYLFHIGDAPASEYAKQDRARARIEARARTGARSVLTHLPLPRPEILLGARDENAWNRYESSWAEHLAMLQEAYGAK
jgi:glycosyltransferase involved in cell wall biosynthesis